MVARIGISVVGYSTRSGEDLRSIGEAWAVVEGFRLLPRTQLVCPVLPLALSLRRNQIKNS